MNFRLIALIGAVMAFAAIAVGCGSSDDSTTDSTASLTKAEFVKQGNAICAAGNKEINAGFEELSFDEKKGPSDAQIEEVAEDTLVPSVSKQIEEIRALGLPSGEEEQVEKFLDNAEAAVEEVEDDPGSITGNQDPFAEVNKEASAVGLVKCGE